MCVNVCVAVTVVSYCLCRCVHGVNCCVAAAFTLTQKFTTGLAPQFTIFILSDDGLKPQISFFYFPSLFGEVKKKLRVFCLFLLFDVQNVTQHLFSMVALVVFNLALLQGLFSHMLSTMRLGWVNLGPCMPCLKTG